MIAQIIPLTRLPRRLNLFDYSVPIDLEKIIMPGQLVSIPFRKSKIFGLVFSINKDNEDNKEIKSIIELVNESPFLSEKNLLFLQKISCLYGTSLGLIGKSMLLPLQKNKLKKIIINKISEQKTNTLNPAQFRIYQNNEEHQKMIREICKNDFSLFLVPENHLIEKIIKLIPKEFENDIAVWHSEMTIKQQFTEWLKIRNCEKRIIIGTRSAVFLTFGRLDKIIIDYEHDENHKHWDQNPRFHDKDVAELLSSAYGAKIIYSGFSPSCESYYRIFKKNLSFSSTYRQENDELPKILFQNHKNNKSDIEIISMSDEKKGGNYDLLSNAALNKILNTNGDIFIYINKLGSASVIKCQDCGFVFNCNNCQLPYIYHENSKTIVCHYCNQSFPQPLKCDKCKSVLLKNYGIGIEAVEKKINNIIKNKNDIFVQRIDSETAKKNHLTTDKRKIIIGTKMAVSKIDWKKIKTFIFLEIDRQLNIPEYRNSEQIWHLLKEIDFLRNEDCEFLIQTENIDHLIFKSLKEPDRFYRTELNLRQKLNYPPYIYLIRYFYGNSDKNFAQKESERVFSELSAALTKLTIPAILNRPVSMHPHYFRKKFWYNIVVKLPIEGWQENIAKLNSYIPENWKIDPNPISILSP